MISLSTARLTVRNFSTEDWPELQKLAIAYKAFPNRYEDAWPTSEEDVKGMASWFSGGDGYLAACFAASGKLIGLIAIAHHDDHPGHEHGLGYVFHPDHHGHGYATEAAQVAMDYVFGEHGADAIRTGTHRDNARSTKLLERLGLQLAEDGHYTIIREDWLLLSRHK
jgi:ribosomal-protein-alanine N-acetyltransferase